MNIRALVGTDHGGSDSLKQMAKPGIQTQGRGQRQTAFPATSLVQDEKQWRWKWEKEGGLKLNELNVLPLCTTLNQGAVASGHQLSKGPVSRVASPPVCTELKRPFLSEAS